MGNQSFVRTEMLEEQHPPASQTGIVKWLLENLFSSVTNSILTILAAYFIFTGYYLFFFLDNSTNRNS